jgi:hypothetical protein
VGPTFAPKQVQQQSKCLSVWALVCMSMYTQMCVHVHVNVWWAGGTQIKKASRKHKKPSKERSKKLKVGSPEFYAWMAERQVGAIQ